MTNVVSKDAVPTIDYLASAFRKPEYDARIADTKYDYFYPISGTKDTSCLRWTIPHNNGQYVPNVEKMVLAVDLKITNADKSGVPAAGIESGPCNNFINSIFGTLRICYNTECVAKIDHYPIYNYTRMLLNNDNNDFDTWAVTRCFFKEGEDEDLDEINTVGWNKRRNCFGGKIKLGSSHRDYSTLNSKFKYSDRSNFFIGKLDHYLPQPPLLPNTDIHVELDLNKPKWVFQSKDDTADNCDINFEFDKARLYVPSTKLNDQLYLQLENRLKKEPLRQFFTSTHLNTHGISTGDKTATFSLIAPGMYPSRLFIMLQETSRQQGKFSLNSLKFPRVYNTKGDPFMLENIKVKLNNEEVEGLACDDAVNSFRDQYFRLFHLTNQDTGKNACSITFKDFLHHNCFLVYDFTSTLNETEYPLLPVLRKGSLRVELFFDKPTTCPMTLITMMELQSALTIEDSGKCNVNNI